MLFCVKSSFNPSKAVLTSDPEKCLSDKTWIRKYWQVVKNSIKCFSPVSNVERRIMRFLQSTVLVSLWTELQSSYYLNKHTIEVFFQSFISSKTFSMSCFFYWCFCCFSQRETTVALISRLTRPELIFLKKFSRSRRRSNIEKKKNCRLRQQQQTVPLRPSQAEQTPVERLVPEQLLAPVDRLKSLWTNKYPYHTASSNVGLLGVVFTSGLKIQL